MTHLFQGNTLDKNDRLQRWPRHDIEWKDWLRELNKQTVGTYSTWTGVVRGSGTAGTYEIDTQQSYYYRIGKLVYLHVDILLAGAITAGGTGDLNITGVPYDKLTGYFPTGPTTLGNVNYTAAGQQQLTFVSSSNTDTLNILESNDAGVGTVVPISGVVATSRIIGSIQYITSDT